MLGLFRAVVERVKGVLVVRAARETEADAIAHAAHRRAELLELAARYEAQGQGEVAGELRAAVGTVDDNRPLAGVLPAVDHLTGGATDTAEETPRLALPGRGARRKQPTVTVDGFHIVVTWR
jgi:hypothetical protein